MADLTRAFNKIAGFAGASSLRTMGRAAMAGNWRGAGRAGLNFLSHGARGFINNGLGTQYKMRGIGRAAAGMAVGAGAGYLASEAWDHPLATAGVVGAGVLGYRNRATIGGFLGRAEALGRSKLSAWGLMK